MTSGFVLSWHIDPATIPSDGTRRSVVATPEECREIASRFGLLGLDELAADLELRPWRGEGVEISGRLRARLSQSCVVTLEPVAQEIDEEFQVRLAPEGSALAGEPPRPQSEIAVDPEADDPPDVYSGQIDLGPIVEEQLALFVDPYPRAPGAELPAVEDAADTKAEKAESPFAVLAGLARRKPEDDKP